jgi:hypothetical protein
MEGRDMSVDILAGDRLTVRAERSVTQRQEDARSRIAYVLIGIYVVLLLANIGIPLALYVSSRPRGALSITDFKDLTLAISAALGSLVGVLGVVIGFYFKSLGESAASRKLTR